MLTFISTCLVADDTEIFTGRSDSSSAVPNVLFILDNSDTMGQPFQGGGPTRLEALKDSFSQLVNTVEGVNIGIMRFDGPGGSIAFPVTNLNSEMTIPFLESPEIMEIGDDASENLKTNEVTVNDDSIILTYDSGNITTDSTSAPIIQESDSAEENISDGMIRNGVIFNINNSQINALRFTDLDIPVGSVIDSARIRFTASSYFSSASTILITADSAINPSTVNTTKKYNISSRAPAVKQNIWTVNDAWIKDEIYYTDDLSSIVQEAINRPEWSPNSALFFMFQHQLGGERAGYRYNPSDAGTHGLTGNGPVLEITYHTGSNEPSFLNVGLRFQNVAVPRGATITNARIKFTPSVSASGATNFVVQAQNSGNANGFMSTNSNITNQIERPRLGDVVPWSITDDWIKDQPQTGPDLSLLVQNIVNRSDWCGNNSLAFFITGSSIINRQFYSFDAGSDLEPKLSVEYTYDPSIAPDDSGCINPIFPFYISSSEQDAVESNSGGNRTSNDEEFLLINSSHRSGLRFKDIPLRQGSTVISAYLKLFAHPLNDNSGTMNITIEGHDIGNAPAFPETRRNITDRARTTASVNWSADSWTSEEVYQSDDIGPIIQEVLSRGDWNPGNNLALILSTSDSGERYAYSWDGSSGKSAQLIIQVADGGIDHSNNTVRQHLASVIESYEAITEVPLVDTIYEAARYFRGNSVYYGSKRELFPPQADNTPIRYKRVSHADSYTSGTNILPLDCPSSTSNDVACELEEIIGSPTYKSPISSACQSNHIVVLTNGLPSKRHQPTEDGINSWTSAWKGRSCQNDSDRESERCGRDLVEWLANVDQASTITDYDNVINTHTIALNVNSVSFRDYLQDLAVLGDGLFREANSSAELTLAFNDILRSVLKMNTTFVSPGTTINQFNRLTHRNEVYFSLFRPDRDPKWIGNLKRYKLLGSPPTILDANDETAVDTETGFFKKSSKSVWSSMSDGDDVSLGGSAYKLPEPSLRKAYTYLSGITGASKNLINTKNKLHENNSDLSTAMLGVADTAKRNQVLQWARGVDLNDWDEDSDISEQRLQMGDPLHSVPVIATYGGTSENPDITVFVGTNEGFLHAIDAKDGSEHFSFIPEELLGNLEEFYDNNIPFSHPYGLDGPITIWMNDLDFNGSIDGTDHVYLYIGMRRGGNNIYALDVTDVNNPKFLWKLEGGIDDYSQLGQTWSKPVKTKIMIEDRKKEVLIFTGGYDPDQDNTTEITTDDIGNAVYIVDAITGDRLWIGYDGATVFEGEHFVDMDYSMPANISIIDINQDGLADQMYASDVGGQIWRFDINNGEPVSNLVDGGVIARVSGSGPENTRRFFNKPNVSMLAKNGQLKIAVSIGSGSRFNPLNEVIVDRFYTIFQNEVNSRPGSYTVLTELDLDDRTYNTSDIPDSKGWYITLNNLGEKVLSDSVTVNNTIFFNTYTPASSGNTCQAVVGQGRTYAVKAFNASAAFDLDKNGSLDNLLDRERLLSSGTIPPPPKLVVTEEGLLTLLVGPEQPYIDIGLGAIRADRWFNSYWYERF